MNTPAHAVFNLLVLGRKNHPEDLAPITVGAVLPDLPMVFFYAVHKLALRTPEAIIWSQSYYDPVWQLVFDLFNSIPILAIFGFVAWRLGSRWCVLLAASMALHALCDLPLHNDDGHRHFFPTLELAFRESDLILGPSSLRDLGRPGRDRHGHRRFDLALPSLRHPLGPESSLCSLRPAICSTSATFLSFGCNESATRPDFGRATLGADVPEP